jgi:DNA-binding NtrC family response regulator
VILVVDDEADMLSAIRRMLAPLELEVRYFDDPRDALAALGRLDGVRLLLSDLDMPLMSGTELLERARGLRPEVVRMIMTGRGSLDAAVQAINTIEVHRFVRKPFQADELRAAVASALARFHEASRRVGPAPTPTPCPAADELERKHLGISQFARDATGAYAIDGVRYRLGERMLASLGILRDRH